MTLPLINNDPAMPPPILELRSCNMYYAPSLSYENPPPHPYLNNGAQKKTDLIDRLVETSAEIIDSIWPQQQTSSHDPHMKVVHTRAFIQEILRRSKTTYSNLQVCLFYLFRVKKAVVVRMMTIQKEKKKSREDHILCCGRRMFLAALMVSAKFLQDKNYRNRAWARLSGLALHEINAAEMLFLRLINYNLYISQSTFDQWHSLLQAYLCRPSPQGQKQSDSEICIGCYLRTLSPPNACVSPCHPTVTTFRPDRPSSYPSPPLSDELGSAPLTPPLSLISNSSSHSKRPLEKDDDQDHHPSSTKRHCIDFN